MFVSVIIPVYNGERFLRDSVSNVLAQGHEPLEIIVVDDGSTDGTPEVIRSFGDRVRSVRLAQNRGPAAARNAGIEIALGSVIAFLDVDDLWPTGRLPAMLAPLIGDPGCSIVKGYARVAHSLDPESDPRTLSPPVLGPWIGSALYRREVFREVGLYDPSLRYSEDIDWFLRARELKVGLHILKRVTLYVRRHDTNMTRGRDCYEMNVIGVLKSSLDRRRGQTDGFAERLSRPIISSFDNVGENAVDPVSQSPR